MTYFSGEVFEFELFLKSGERDRKTFLLNVIKGKYNVRSRFYLEWSGSPNGILKNLIKINTI